MAHPIPLADGPGRAPATPLEVLAAAARAGDAEAAGQLWTSVRGRLLRICLALGAPPADAPDLVQETLLAGHRALAEFDPARGRFEAWIGTILFRRVQNARRAERRRRRVLGLLRTVAGPVLSRGSHPIDAVEARMTLGRLLGALTDSQRDVVALYEIGELPAEQVALALGITAAGVRSIARDARERLAREARGLRGSNEVHS